MIHWRLENVNAVAHDIGGTIALAISADHPDAFSKLTVIDPVVLEPWGSPFYSHVAKWQEAFSTLPEFAHKALLSAYVASAQVSEPVNSFIEQTMVPWLGKEGQAAFYRQIAQASKVFTKTLSEKLFSISSPVQIIWGSNDTWLPSTQAKDLAKLIPSSQVEIMRETGHLLIEEKPQELNEILLRFHKNL